MSDERSLELAGGALPAPSSIAAQLRRQLNDAVLVERERRGEVRLPEDTWPMMRALARVVETCGEYERAFKKAVTEANQVAEEDLIEAVGAQNHVPTHGMTVPDADGDVKVNLDLANSYEFDQAALLNAVAFAVREQHDAVNVLLQIMKMFGDRMTEDEARHRDDQIDEFISHLLLAAMRELCELGKFEPQVTKVKKFTASLARGTDADDVVSSVTSSTIRRTKYKGVKVVREVPK
jgi:hypothetical protein